MHLQNIESYARHWNFNLAVGVQPGSLSLCPILKETVQFCNTDPSLTWLPKRTQGPLYKPGFRPKLYSMVKSSTKEGIFYGFPGVKKRRGMLGEHEKGLKFSCYFSFFFFVFLFDLFTVACARLSVSGDTEAKKRAREKRRWSGKEKWGEKERESLWASFNFFLTRLFVKCIMPKCAA